MIVSLIMIVALFSNYVFIPVQCYEQNHVSYRVNVDFYVKANKTLKESFRPLGEVMLEINVEGKKVNLLLRPESFDEFRYYFSKLLEENIVIINAQGSNSTSIANYNQYILDQLKNNETYAKQMYSKYLNGVKIGNITVSYTLDDNNYVIEFPEVGFFPLYSVKPLYPDTIEQERPVYYGSKVISNGIVGTNVPYTDLMGYFLELTAQHVSIVDNKPGVDSVFYFKRNYLVKGSNIILPVNKSTYVLFESFTPTNDTINLIQSVPDYKLYSEDYWFPLLIGVVVVAGVAGVLLWRRRV